MKSLVRVVFNAVWICLLVGCNDPVARGRPLSSWRIDLDAKEDFKRRLACEAIAELGPVAEKAIADLVPLLDDVNVGVREFAELALGKMGPSALVALHKELKAKKPHVRLHAAAAMVAIDPRHLEAIGVLSKGVMGVGNAALAEKAVEVVVRLGAPAVPSLLVGLSDPYPPVRMQVVKTLTAMKSEARGSVDGLMKTAKEDADVAIRGAALQAVAVAGEKSVVEPFFRSMLDDEAEEVANAAGSMLVFIGARGGSAGDVEMPQTEAKVDAKGLSILTEATADDP